MIRSLLVPLDGSPFGEQALPLAREVARRCHAAVQLAHVHVPVTDACGGPAMATDLQLEQELRDQEREYLEGVARGLAREGTTARPALLEGPVVEALHEQALAAGADLVVMTTHGRGPLSRFWLGSVSDQLLRRLPVPLLLVRPHESAAPAAPRHVLVPLDGSEQAEQVLGPALELARLLGADLTLLRAVEPVVLPDRHLAGNAAGGIDPDLLRGLEEGARAYLGRVAASLRGLAPRLATRVAVNRRAADAILEEAGGHGNTLVALVTHGRAGLSRVVLGSVADKVIRGSAGPVLVYRPPAG
jgi:nucleotide-binding universal stress UspA family protein